MILHRGLWILLSLLCLSTSAKVAFADLTAAEQLLQAGKVLDARDLYRGAWSTGEWKQAKDPANYFYNWSLAEWKSGDKGTAVAAAISAKRFSYGNPDLDHNIEFMLGQLDPSARAFEPEYSFPASLLRTDAIKSELLWLLGIFCCLLGLFLSLWGKNFSPSAGIALCVSALFLFFGTCLYSREQSSLVVTKSNSTTLRSGPGESFPSLESVLPGAVLFVSKEQEAWLQVTYRKSGGPITVAWLAAKDAAAVATR